MVIRCERCSTTYELDESLLAATGSEVQCTKCQHVFTAFPPRSPGRTLAGVPAQPQPEPEASPAPAASPAPRRAPPSTPATQPSPPRPAGSPATAQASSAGRANGGAPPKAVRTTAPSIYRPQASAVPGGSAASNRGPVLKRDTVGSFEARLRWSARWRWLAPVAAVGVVAILVGAWALLGRRGDAGAERIRAESLALVALDDAASVDEAVSRLSAVVKKRPKLRSAAADRALALVVRAAGLAEEAEALSVRAGVARDERERAHREQFQGWQESERAASAEAQILEPEVRAREEKTRAASSGAREQLAILQAEAGETPEVVRAQALLHALGGERDRLHRLVRLAREKGVRDPWVDLADGWGDARDPDRGARERALVKLGAVAAARPDLVRGRYLLARAQLSLGRKADALATVEGVLAANPKHEGAKRLREELTAAPATQPPPPPQPQPLSEGAPPPAKPAPQVRKIVPQPGTAGSAAAASGSRPPAPAASPAVVPQTAPPAEPTPAEREPSAIPSPPPAAPPSGAPSDTSPPAAAPAAPAPRPRVTPSPLPSDAGG